MGNHSIAGIVLCSITYGTSSLFVLATTGTQYTHTQTVSMAQPKLSFDRKWWLYLQPCISMV